jgi:hypothetical protein
LYWTSLEGWHFCPELELTSPVPRSPVLKSPVPGRSPSPERLPLPDSARDLDSVSIEGAGAGSGDGASSEPAPEEAAEPATGAGLAAEPESELDPELGDPELDAEGW